MQVADLQVIKDIPGFKVILKAVLKSQIQQMVEQLAEYTGEESVLLTASVSDGSLSHLGSESGKFFLEDHDDIKSQFLGFCLKRYHRQKQLELTHQDEILDSSGGIRPGPVSPRKFGPGSKPRASRPYTGSNNSPSHISPSHSPIPSHIPVHPIALVKSTNGKPSRSSTKSVRHDPYTVSQLRHSAQKALHKHGIESAMNQALDFIPMEPVVDQDSYRQADASTGEGGNVKVEVIDRVHDNEIYNDEMANTFGDQDYNQTRDLQPHNSTPVNVKGKKSSKSGIPARDVLESSYSVSSEISEQNSSELDQGVSYQGASVETEMTNMNKDSGETGASDLEPKDIKVEAITESEMELKITGVEQGHMPQVGDGWVATNPETIGYGPPIAGVYGQGEIPPGPSNHGNKETNQSSAELSASPQLDSEAQDLRWSKEQRKVGIPRLLPETATQVMKAWLFRNIMNPYPPEDVKRQMASQTNLNLVQINNWFTNARRRIIQPMLDANNTEEAIEKLARYTSHHAHRPWTASGPSAEGSDSTSHKTDRQKTKKSPPNTKSGRIPPNSYPGPDYHFDIRPRYDGTDQGGNSPGTHM